MPNMSYCRFQNTVNDLKDCADHITEDFENDEPLSREEFEARQTLVELCREIAGKFDYDDRFEGTYKEYRQSIKTPADKQAETDHRMETEEDR